MSRVLQLIFGSDPKTTIIGYVIAALQATSASGAHSLKGYAVAFGMALLGRFVNEGQSSAAPATKQGGFVRLPLLAMILVIFVLASFAPAMAADVSNHAMAKVAKVASAPVIHPKKTVKQVIGSAFFVAENVVDVVHVCLETLDNGTATELVAIHYIVHPADVAVGYVDTDLLKAENFFFDISSTPAPAAPATTPAPTSQPASGSQQSGATQ